MLKIKSSEERVAIVVAMKMIVIMESIFILRRFAKLKLKPFDAIT